MPQPKRQPEKKIGPFPNGIGVAIWVNEVETQNGPRAFRSVSIAPRRYFDRETNQWKDASSYQPGDLPALIHALTLTLAYCDHTPLAGQDAGGTTDHSENGAPADLGTAGQPVEVPF